MTAVRISPQRAGRVHGDNRRFTPEQAREFRLSLEKSVVIARRYEVGTHLIADLRRGRTYGRLLDDEQYAEDVRKGRISPDHYRPSDHFIAVGSAYVAGGMLVDEDRQEAKDAAYECAHGRLPHDPTGPCGCWPQEQTNPNPRRINGNHHERARRFAAQAARADRPVGEDRRVEDRPLLAAGHGRG